MRFLKIIVLPLLSLSFAFAQSTPAGPGKANVRFTPDMLDKNVDPCVDFYAYACSKWQAQNPVPSDRSSWGRSNELTERGEYILRDILDKYSLNDAKRSAPEQQIGDYYQGCMDESAIERAGTAPLQEELKAIDFLKSKQDLAAEAIRLHRRG